MTNLTPTQRAENRILNNLYNLYNISNHICELTKLNDGATFDTDDADTLDNIHTVHHELEDLDDYPINYDQSNDSYYIGDDDNNLFSTREMANEHAYDLAGLDHWEASAYEVYEHYLILDSNLADQLQRHGEKVVSLMGLPYIWCRTTTGQSVLCDSVIQRIINHLVSL